MCDENDIVNVLIHTWKHLLCDNTYYLWRRTFLYLIRGKFLYFSRSVASNKSNAQWKEEKEKKLLLLIVYNQIKNSFKGGDSDEHNGNSVLHPPHCRILNL